MVYISVLLGLLFVSPLDCKPHEVGSLLSSLVSRTWNREGAQSIFFECIKECFEVPGTGGQLGTTVSKLAGTGSAGTVSLLLAARGMPV